MLHQNLSKILKIYLFGYTFNIIEKLKTYGNIWKIKNLFMTRIMDHYHGFIEIRKNIS